MEEQSIEALGMRLANRAYLFRVFHIAFGAEPTAEVLRVLGSQETINAVGHLADACREEGVRVLSETGDGAREVLAEQALSDAVGLFVAFGDAANDEEYAEALRSSFTRLFLVPGESCVHPWESPYVGKEVMLFQESTLDVRHRYAEYGFAAVEFGHFPEDHVSMMLDYLAHLSNRAFDAFGDGRDGEVRRILASQKDFVSVHLANWLPDFQEELRKKDVGGEFCRIAEALRAFLAVDDRFMEQMATKFETMDR